MNLLLQHSEIFSSQFCNFCELVSASACLFVALPVYSVVVVTVAVVVVAKSFALENWSHCLIRSRKDALDVLVSVCDGIH